MAASDSPQVVIRPPSQPTVRPGPPVRAETARPFPFTMKVGRTWALLALLSLQRLPAYGASDSTGFGDTPLDFSDTSDTKPLP